MDTVTRLAKRNGRSMLIMTIVFFLAASFWSMSGHDGTIISQVDKEMLGVAGDNGSVFISMEDILSVELLNNLDIGICISGESGDNVNMGKFQNEIYGEYLLYAYKEAGSYIAVHYGEDVLVFNNRSRKITEKTYEELINASVTSRKEVCYGKNE
ncbi:hypothetical protein [Hungatella hathewayi]